MDFLRRSLSGRGHGLLWLIMLLSATSLSCISFNVSIKVRHEQGERGEIQGQIGVHLTDEYLSAVQTANQERAADYQSAGLDIPEPLFPETWAEFDEAGFGFSDLLEGDVEILEQSDKGYIVAGSRTYTESSGLGVEDGSLDLRVDRTDPEKIVYVLEMEIQDMSEELDPADLDQLRAEGLGPKPAVEAETGQIELDAAKEDLGTEIVTTILEELLGAVPETAGLELDGWYAEKVLLAAGLPSMSYSVELPGKITSHTLAGETAGTLNPSGNRVELVVDEAFMRRAGPKSGLWRITSELHKCDEICTKTDHMIWDGSSPPDSCRCDCEAGWTLSSDGKSCEADTGEGSSKPRNPARNMEDTDQFEKLLRSRGYSEKHCTSGAYPPGSVIVWNLNGGIAHSSVMTAGERQIEMGDKPGGKRYVSELLPAKTNPTASRGRSYAFNTVLCPPPGTHFDSSGAQTMDGIDRNYGETNKWNCHGFSANVVARYANTGIRIEPGSNYLWEGNKLILQSGRVYVKDNHALQIQVKGGTLHPMSEYVVEATSTGELQLIVLEGTVRYDGIADSVTVGSGQRLSVSPTGEIGPVTSIGEASGGPWWETMDEELFRPSETLGLPASWSSWMLAGVGLVCGSGLAISGGGVLLLRRRRRGDSAARPQRHDQAAGHAARDPFALAEHRRTQLIQAYRAGQIDLASVQQALARQIIQFPAGNYWAMGGDDGRWHWFDGKNWVPRDRPQ
jgi:hypothetical protein